MCSNWDLHGIWLFSGIGIVCFLKQYHSIWSTMQNCRWHFLFSTREQIWMFFIIQYWMLYITWWETLKWLWGSQVSCRILWITYKHRIVALGPEHCFLQSVCNIEVHYGLLWRVQDMGSLEIPTYFGWLGVFGAACGDNSISPCSLYITQAATKANGWSVSSNSVKKVATGLQEDKVYRIIC